MAFQNRFFCSATAKIGTNIHTIQNQPPSTNDDTAEYLHPMTDQRIGQTSRDSINVAVASDFGFVCTCYQYIEFEFEYPTKRMKEYISD